MIVTPRISTLIAAVAIATTSACSFGAFDDRAEGAWSVSQGAPSGVDGDHGLLVTTVSNERPGLHIVSVAAGPAGMSTHSFDEFGTKSSAGISLADLIPATVDLSVAELVGATENIAGADGLIALGGLGELNQILLFDAETGSTGPTFRKAIDASACGPGIANLGENMAFGLTDMGAPDGLDLVAASGPDLMVFPDIDTSAGPPTCFRCTLVNSVDIFDLVTADIDDDEIDDVLFSSNGQLVALRASLIQDHDDNDAECFAFATPQISGLTAPNGEFDFGAKMAVGSFDEDEFPEFAMWSRTTGTVYLLQSLSASGPSSNPVRMLTSAGSSAQFGTQMAFGNVDGFEGDEILIGDSGASPDGVTAAGSVVVFSFGGGEVEPLTTLYDSDPNDNQRFGRSLAVGEFVGAADDTDLLIVGALGEVFTYFRATLTATDPRAD